MKSLIIMLVLSGCAPAVAPFTEDYARCEHDAQCLPGRTCAAFGESRTVCRPRCESHRDCPLPAHEVTAAPACGPQHLCILSCLDIATAYCGSDSTCIPFVGSPPYGYCQ